MGERTLALKSGHLDRRLTIQRAVYTTNSFNEQVAEWQTLMVVWASKRDVGDGERIAAQQVSAHITTRFQFKWSSLAGTVSPTDRLIFEGRIYEIFSVKELGRREGIEISAAARAEVEKINEVTTAGAVGQQQGVDGGAGAAQAGGSMIVSGSGSAGGQGG